MVEKKEGNEDSSLDVERLTMTGMCQVGGDKDSKDY